MNWLWTWRQWKRDRALTEARRADEREQRAARQRLLDGISHDRHPGRNQRGRNETAPDPGRWHRHRADAVPAAGRTGNRDAR
jgi:hypothetical protein